MKPKLLKVYPPFIIGRDGYDVPLWEGMDERDERRTEGVAREHAEKVWSLSHPSDDIRYERRTRVEGESGPDKSRGYIRVLFSDQPILSREADFLDRLVSVAGERNAVQV